ncbi:transcription elongation factor GreA [soil metagenome]
MKTITFTKAGFDKMQEEQKKLLGERPAAVIDLKTARDLGDLSENGYYKSARQKLSFIDHRLRQLKYILKEAVIVAPTQIDTVTIGCQVTIKNEKEEKTYTIVGGYESNPLEGKMSHRSPIGSALIGKKVGDKVEVIIPSGSVTYTIEKITL